MAEKKGDTLTKMLPALTVLLALGVAVGAYFVLLLPKLSSLSGGSAVELAAIEVQLDSDEAYVKRIDEALDKYRLMNTQLRQKTQAIIPLEVDTPGIFAQLDGVARKHNLVVTAVSTTIIEDEIGAFGQRLVKVSSNIEGGDYRQFKTFLADLERSVRLIDVQSVVFTPLSSKYSLTMKTYYLDPAADAEADADILAP